MDIPCNFKVAGCDCPESSPFKNLSAEAPDPPIFISTYYGKEIPPIGFEWARFTCSGVCISTTSQLDADLCAQRQAFDCIVGTWTSDGGGPGGPPVPPPQNTIGRRRTPIFRSAAQTVSVQCPDGLPFTFSVEAGLFAGFSQLDADTKAQSFALEQAQLNQICLGNITTPACVNAVYASAIVASGVEGNQNVWELAGTLPPGLSIPELIFTTALTGNTLHIEGTPTVPGVYNFTITVTDLDQNFMSKPYQIVVMGITNLDDLPAGTIGVAYSFVPSAVGFTNPIYSIESGTLPDGLAINSATGEITGTPTVEDTFDFVIGITEAGTGVTCLMPAEIVVENASDCANMPTETTTENPGPFFGSVAVLPLDKYLVAYDGNGPTMSLFNVENGGFVPVTSVTTDFSLGRVIWSPLANEWVDCATDPGTTLEVWFTSYNKLTLAKVGQKQSTNASASQGQPRALACSATTGMVWAAPSPSEIRSYDSVTHTLGPNLNLAGLGTCLGSFGYNETTNRLYIALGGGTPAVRVYDGTTLAFLDSFALPASVVNGCKFNPDNGLLYVAGNDNAADGGDLVWVYNPTSHALIATIRLLTDFRKATVNLQEQLPTTLAYDSDTHQIYIYATIERVFPPNPPSNGGMNVICCESNTLVGTFPLHPDTNFGTFFGDVTYGVVVNTTPPNTPTVWGVSIDSPAFISVIRGYTFP